MSPRHLLHASCALSLLALTGVACDGNSNAAPEAATPEAATAAQVEPASAQPPGPPPEKPLDGYVAHEWGLVRYHAQAPEVATSYFGRHLPTPTVATPKPKPPKPRPVRPRPRPKPKKPLIYLRPDPGFDTSTAIDVTVTMASGSLREVWPTPLAKAQPEHERSFLWDDVTLERGVSCGKQIVPRLDEPACTSLTDGGVCEAAELADYIADVPDCLSVSGVRSPVLLYNGTLAAAAPPVAADGMTVRNTSEHAVGPLYVNAPGGLYRLDSVAAGASASLEGREPMALDDAGVVKNIRADLRALGLTQAEANDFIAAWEPDVLSLPVTFQAFGFLSKDGVDAVATLSFDPAPRELVRVLAFSVDADAKPTLTRKK
jgi:hypothetical protein